MITRAKAAPPQSRYADLGGTDSDHLSTSATCNVTHITAHRSKYLIRALDLPVRTK
jgi:hypothetical protein